MRYILIILALVAVACGGSTVETTTTTTTTSTTTSTTTTTTTTPLASTMTAEPVDPLMVIASQLAGTYTGQWRNTTFGSTGPINATMTVTEEGRMEVTLDVDGSVFGQADPPAEEFSFDLADIGDGATLDSAVFGPMTFAVTPVGITVTAGDVPSEGIKSMEVALALVEDGFEGTYVVEFDDGNTAEGTLGIAFTG